MEPPDIPAAKWRRISFTWLLPVLSLFVAVVAYLVPSIASLVRLKQVAHGGTVTINSRDLQIVIPQDHLASFALQATAFRAEKWIFAVDLPGHFVDVALSYLISRTPFWSPAALGPSTWHCLTYPFFALPAWFYIGRGTDALFGRRVASAGAGILSLVLSLLSAVLCFGFLFGITPEERADQPYLMGSIYGLGLWSLLLLIPFAAWLRLKRRRKGLMTMMK